MVFTIGIDPHKATHTAAVVDSSEVVVAELRFAADARQRDRLLTFAARFAPRTWAIEQATGLGALLAQQLVAVGETVLDVPPTLSARVRLLDSTRTDKTDSHDARAAAIVALRHPQGSEVMVTVGEESDPGGVPVARIAVPAHRRRSQRTTVSPAGGRDPASDPGRRAGHR
jgi:transposase